MKANKILIALLTAGLLLCGCQGNQPADETDAGETEVQAVTDLVIAENGQSAYTVVLPDRCSDTASAAGTKIWKTFTETYNTEIGLANDWVADPAEIPVGTPEILIGDTNRPETAAVKAELGEDLYRVAIENNRIVIVATHDRFLDQALNALLENIAADDTGRYALPGDLLLTARNDWPLAGVPVYDGGLTYNVTFAEPFGFAKENPSLLLGITDTNADEFAAYVEKLQNDGFTAVQRADWGGVTAYQCDKADTSVYTYFTAYDNTVRIILDNSQSVSPEEFGYTYEAAEGETNDVFLYGMQAPIYDEANQEISGVGQFMFIKLADNSLIIIDGGHKQQPNAEEFLRVAREMTGTPEGEKIRIACWFITHRHSDHIWGAERILKDHADQFTLERVMHNHRNGADFDFSEYYQDVLYHAPRTGETLQFGNLTMEVLYTHEDLLDPQYMTYTSDEYNDSGTVLKIHFDGKICMILGDIDQSAAKIIRQMYTEEQLKADVVQIAHHGLNAIPDLYNIMDAKIALVPAQEWYFNGKAAYSTVNKVNDEWYCSDNTVGVRVIDGEAQVFYTSPAVFNN
ncbi:MAG: hypothetical protein E7658_02005 [Ruminococcaceae bacterium]|nr:hypothetical protein [Oscillospiraceae bacterium]